MQYNILKSRTFWTSVALFVVNTVNIISPILPPAWQAFANAVLGLMVLYFHVNPSQQYAPVQQG